MCFPNILTIRLNPPIHYVEDYFFGPPRKKYPRASLMKTTNPFEIFIKTLGFGILLNCAISLFSLFLERPSFFSVFRIWATGVEEPAKQLLRELAFFSEINKGVGTQNKPMLCDGSLPRITPIQCLAMEIFEGQRLNNRLEGKMERQQEKRVQTASAFPVGI